MVEIRQKNNPTVLRHIETEDATYFLMQGKSGEYVYAYPKSIWERVPLAEWEDITADVTFSESGLMFWKKRHLDEAAFKKGEFRLVHGGASITIERKL